MKNLNDTLKNNIFLFEKQEQTIKEKVDFLENFLKNISKEDKDDLFNYYNIKYKYSFKFLPILSCDSNKIKNINSCISIIDHYIFNSYLDFVKIIIENGYVLNKEQNNLLFSNLFKDKNYFLTSENAIEFFLNYFKESSHKTRESFFIHMINQGLVIDQNIDFFVENTKDIFLDYNLFSDFLSYNHSFFSLVLLNKFVEQKNINFQDKSSLDEILFLFSFDSKLKENVDFYKETHLHSNIIINLYKSLDVKNKKQINIFCSPTPFLLSQFEKHDLSVKLETDNMLSTNKNKRI